MGRSVEQPSPEVCSITDYFSVGCRRMARTG